MSAGVLDEVVLGPGTSIEKPVSTRDGRSPHPIPRPLIEMLPAIYQEDSFSNRWLAGFDAVIAPITGSIDCFDAYLDPTLSPIDFVAWVGTWLGVAAHNDMSPSRQRQLVQHAASIYARRGTVSGLRDLVELTFGVRCDVIEGGGVSASTVPAGALPGSAIGAFVVRVSAENQLPLPEHIRAHIKTVVESSRPAHLPAVVEFGENGNSETRTKESKK